MAALGINLGLLIIQIIAFTVVMLTLNAWVYQPMLNMMESRKQKIAQGLEDARVAAEARANAEKEAAKVIADAQTEASKIVREATERAALAGQDVKAAAETEAAKAREAAIAEAEVERNRILGDLRSQVAGLAIAAANKLVGESLDEKRQRALLDEFFSGVKSGNLIVLDGENFQGESAQVTSALPLSKDEEEVVKRDVLAKAGAKEITFRVDPSILGGLVIRVGDKVLDNSVAGKLEGLRQNIKNHFNISLQKSRCSFVW
jgi:F-type H+-transporting ATPase subunit b